MKYNQKCFFRQFSTKKIRKSKKINKGYWARLDNFGFPFAYFLTANAQHFFKERRLITSLC